MLFLDDIFLILVVGVELSSYSIMRAYRTIISVISFLGIGCSKVIVVFKVLGVDFLLNPFGLFIGLLFSALYDFVCLPVILFYFS